MKITAPTIHTERLTLSPFVSEDADDVAALAGALEVAATTVNIPHPYEPHMAREWFASHDPLLELGTGLHLKITRKADGALIGGLGFAGISTAHSHAELGYWIAVPYWKMGYATEAARALMVYGFETLGLHRIHAHHFANNPGSGRVLTKIGMLPEGVWRHHVRKWDAFHDVEAYGILSTDPLPPI